MIDAHDTAAPHQGWATDPGRLIELLAINRAIVGTLDFEELLHLVIEKTALFTRADCCALLLANGVTLAKVAASVRVDPIRALRFSAPLDEKIGAAIPYLFDQAGQGTCVTVPVINKGSIDGVLCVYWYGKFEVGYEEQFLLSALADMAAIALGHAAGYQKLYLAEREAVAQLEQIARAECVARERAEEADARKDEFLAMLAHELRNPLMALRTALTLRDKREPGPDPTAQMLRETCSRQVGNLVRMVDDLLEVSRVSATGVVLRRQRVELEQIIHSAVQAARPALEARGHVLSIELAPGPVVLNGDPTRLEQVVCNLLVNAAKYTPVGGRISLTTEQEVTNGAKWVSIRVKDNGVGLAPEMLARVFELFVQVDKSLDRAEGGLGIGLTLVKGLVELHGGTVTAHSAGPGKGSAFTVRLPVDEAAPVPVFEAQPIAAIRQRVLLVEDAPEILETLKLLLEELGHEVEVAESGPEGVAKLLEFLPDVALIDVGLPGIDGYEVARRVRAAPGGAGLYLVALTGYSGAKAEAKAKEAGFDRHVVKPIDVNALGALLARPN